MLSSYRVIDCTDERGQLAGLVLAQLGADVMLVEPPGGSSARWCPPFAGDRRDADSSLWHWAYNRASGRSSLTSQRKPAESGSTISSPTPMCFVDRSTGRDAVLVRQPGGGEPGLVVVVLSPFDSTAEGELGGDRSHRERGRLRRDVGGRRRPSPVALGIAAGVPSRRRRHGGGRPRRVGGAPAVRQRATRRCVRAGLVLAIVVLLLAQRRMELAVDAPIGRRDRLRHVQAAVDVSRRGRCRQHHVLLRRGAGALHREPVPMDLGGGWLRRGHARHALDRAEPGPVLWHSGGVGSGSAVRGHYPVHRHPHARVPHVRGGASARDARADLRHHRGDAERPSHLAPLLGCRAARGHRPRPPPSGPIRPGARRAVTGSRPGAAPRSRREDHPCAGHAVDLRPPRPARARPSPVCACST